MNDRTKTIEKLVKTVRESAKLKVALHDRKPHSVCAYMVTSAAGSIVGGNLRAFIPFAQQDHLCYPTVFKTRRAAKTFIELNPNATDYHVDSQIALIERNIK